MIVIFSLWNTLLVAQDEVRDSPNMPEEMRKEFLRELGIKNQTTFYLKEAEIFVFSVQGHETLERFEFHGGPTPAFHFSNNEFIAARIIDNEFITQLNLPTQLGGERFSFMPVAISYEALAVDEVKRINPAIVTSRTEKACNSFINPFESARGYVDSVTVCFHSPYEVRAEVLFDGKSYDCYWNFNIWEDAEGQFILQHWFEPKRLGFVKFVLTFPSGEEILIELAQEPEPKAKK